MTVGVHARAPVNSTAKVKGHHFNFYADLEGRYGNDIYALVAKCMFWPEGPE